MPGQIPYGADTIAKQSGRKKLAAILALFVVLAASAATLRPNPGQIQHPTPNPGQIQ